MRKYVYREHVRAPMKFFMYLALVVLVLYVSTGIVIGIKAESGRGAEFLIAYSMIGIGLSLMLTIEISIMYVLIYRQFKKVEISLDYDELIYTNYKGTRVIPYDEITYIKQLSIKYTGGWMEIGHKDGNIRLTVVLEGIGDFIKELKQKLDEKELSEKYNEKGLFSFYKTAQFTDNTWDRIYKNIKLLGLIVMGNYMIAAILAILSSELKLTITQILLGFAMPLAGYIISDIVFGRKCAKEIKKEEFTIVKMNIEKNSKDLKRFVLIFSGIGIGINILLSIASLIM